MSLHSSVETIPTKHSSPHHVTISVGDSHLNGELAVPYGASGVVVCLDPRNECAAEMIADTGCATLRLNLLTGKERHEDESTHCLRFNINMLAERLIEVTKWLARRPETANFGFGYFGEDMMGAAALVAAAELGAVLDAVVCRQTRPDFAANALPKIEAPTLLICDRSDPAILEMNRIALARLHCEKQLQVTPTISRERPHEKRDCVGCTLASRWFKAYVRGR